MRKALEDFEEIDNFPSIYNQVIDKETGEFVRKGDPTPNGIDERRTGKISTKEMEREISIYYKLLNLPDTLPKNVFLDDEWWDTYLHTLPESMRLDALNLHWRVRALLEKDAMYIDAEDEDGNNNDSNPNNNSNLSDILSLDDSNHGTKLDSSDSTEEDGNNSFFESDLTAQSHGIENKKLNISKKSTKSLNKYVDNAAIAIHLITEPILQGIKDMLGPPFLYLFDGYKKAKDATDDAEKNLKKD